MLPGVQLYHSMGKQATCLISCALAWLRSRAMMVPSSPIRAANAVVLPASTSSNDQLQPSFLLRRVAGQLWPGWWGA